MPATLLNPELFVVGFCYRLMYEMIIVVFLLSVLYDVGIVDDISMV